MVSLIACFCRVKKISGTGDLKFPVSVIDLPGESEDTALEAVEAPDRRRSVAAESCWLFCTRRRH